MPIPAEGNPGVGGMLPRSHGPCLVGLGLTSSAHKLVARSKIRCGLVVLLPMGWPVAVCPGGTIAHIVEGCSIEKGFLVLLIVETLLWTSAADPLILSCSDIIQNMDVGEGALQEELLHTVSKPVTSSELAVIVLSDFGVKLNDEVNSRTLPWVVLNTRQPVNCLDMV